MIFSSQEKQRNKKCRRSFKSIRKVWPYEKCKFFQKSVEYLGHVIDKEGIQPIQKKVEAILAAKSPNNIQQLQSFMGMVNYYGKFIPKLSTIAAPLNDLRKKEVK